MTPRPQKRQRTESEILSKLNEMSTLSTQFELHRQRLYALDTDILTVLQEWSTKAQTQWEADNQGGWPAYEIPDHISMLAAALEIYLPHIIEPGGTPSEPEKAFQECVRQLRACQLKMLNEWSTIIQRSWQRGNQEDDNYDNDRSNHIVELRQVLSMSFQDAPVETNLKTAYQECVGQLRKCQLQILLSDDAPEDVKSLVDEFQFHSQTESAQKDRIFLDSYYALDNELDTALSELVADAESPQTVERVRAILRSYVLVTNSISDCSAESDCSAASDELATEVCTECKAQTNGHSQLCNMCKNKYKLRYQPSIVAFPASARTR